MNVIFKTFEKAFSSILTEDILKEFCFMKEEYMKFRDDMLNHLYRRALRKKEVTYDELDDISHQIVLK